MDKPTDNPNPFSGGRATGRTYRLLQEVAREAIAGGKVLFMVRSPAHAREFSARIARMVPNGQSCHLSRNPVQVRFGSGGTVEFATVEINTAALERFKGSYWNRVLMDHTVAEPLWEVQHFDDVWARRPQEPKPPQS